jgi:hypothetical protein
MDWKQFNYLFLNPVDVLQAQKRADTDKLFVEHHSSWSIIPRWYD